MSDHTNETHTDETPTVSRRQLLMKLGLGATAVYVAPTLLQLDEAEAQWRGSPGRGRGSRGRGSRGRGRHGRGSRGSGRRHGRGRHGDRESRHQARRDHRRRDGRGYSDGTQPELERAVRGIIRSLQ